MKQRTEKRKARFRKGMVFVHKTIGRVELLEYDRLWDMWRVKTLDRPVVSNTNTLVRREGLLARERGEKGRNG